MEPLDYLRIVLRRWPVIIAVAIVGAAIGFTTAPKRHQAVVVPRAKSYTATYILALDPTSAAATGGGGVTSSAPNLLSMAFLTTAGQVPQMAAKKLGYTGPTGVLASQVSATPNTTVDTLEITVSDPSGARATAIANAFATSLTTYLTTVAQDAQAAATQRLQTALNGVEAQIATLDNKIAGAARSTSSNSTPLEVLQAQRQAYADRYGALFNEFLAAENAPPAASPLVTFQAASALPTGYVATTKSKLPSSRTARAAIGGLLGLLIAAAAAVAVDLLDPRIRSVGAAERAYRIPVLAELPFIAEVRRGLPIVAREPSSAAADAYRRLRAALLFGARPVMPSVPAQPVVVGADGAERPSPPPLRPEALPGWDGSLAVLLVTAADPAQGTSTVVANLAASFAEAGRSVLVISADFRTPAVHRYLGAAAVPGLTDALADPSRRGIGPVMQTTRVPGVRLVPSGTPLENEIELLTRARAAVTEARHLADVVIIDTPPITAVSDASELIPAVDGVLLVCRAPGAHVASAKAAIDIAERIGAPLLGVALLTNSGRSTARQSRLARAISRKESGPVSASAIVVESSNGSAPARVQTAHPDLVQEDGSGMPSPPVSVDLRSSARNGVEPHDVETVPDRVNANGAHRRAGVEAPVEERLDAPLAVTPHRTGRFRRRRE